MSSIMETALFVEDLSAGYRTRKVFENLTLPALIRGEMTALVGPNAAGKSTLLRAMAGLVTSSGTLKYGDFDLHDLSAAERSTLIGFMPQNLPTGATLTVFESVITALMAAKGGLSTNSAAEERAFAVLRRLGVSHLADKPLDHLSGGQKQIISLAQAVARKPEILLLDEPTSALDLARQFHILQLIRSVAKEGCVVVIVLHDLMLAAQWADRIAVLHEGNIYCSGTPAETITPAMLQVVYRVEARVEHCSLGRLQIMTDGVYPAFSSALAARLDVDK